MANAGRLNDEKKRSGEGGKTGQGGWRKWEKKTGRVEVMVKQTPPTLLNP